MLQRYVNQQRIQFFNSTVVSFISCISQSSMLFNRATKYGLVAILYCLSTPYVSAASCDGKDCLNTIDKTYYRSDQEIQKTVAINSDTSGGSNLKVIDEDKTKIEDLKLALPDRPSLLPDQCSPLRWTEERRVLLESGVVVDPHERGATPGVGHPVVMEIPAPKVHNEFLSSGLNVLDPVEINKSVAIVLNWPQASSLTDARLIGQLPGNLHFDYLNGKMAIFTSCRDELPVTLSHPSISKQFTIRLRTSTGQTDVDIVLPVALYATSHVMTLTPGRTVNQTVEYSGGPLTCNGMTPGPWCGPVTWQYQPSSNNTLPTGLSLQTLSNGNELITGVVDEYAASSGGKLQIQQSGNSYAADLIFNVPITFSANNVSDFSRLHDIERGQEINILLPFPRGGNGHNYDWRLDYYSDQLPPGLQLLSNGRITGTIAATAEIGTRDLTFNVTSPGVYSSRPDMKNSVSTQFRLTMPFSLYTQNTFLRPSDLPEVYHDAANRTQIVGAIISWFTCGPLCTIGGLITGAALDTSLAQSIESAYDIKVQNTTNDNRERMARILSRIAANDYDIVALQEVFQFDPSLNDGNELTHLLQLRSVTSRDYHLLEGPDPAGLEMNSGLALLVKKDLSAINIEHEPMVYQNAPLVVTNNGIPDISFDGLAQKGATVDKIVFGPLPNDYVYVVNTHMQANTGPAYDNLRALQQDELYNFIATYTDPSHPVIIVGDMNVVEANIPPQTGVLTQTTEYFDMLGRLGLSPASDMFRNLHALSSTDGYTVDTTRNAYANIWGSPSQTARERLDYILVRQGSQYQIDLDYSNIVSGPVNTSQCLDWNIPAQSNLECYVSDHFGMSAELRLVRP